MAHHPFGEYRLITECKKLRGEIGAKTARIASIRADDSRNKAEKDRDASAIAREVDALQGLLLTRMARLEDLRTPDSP